MAYRRRQGNPRSSVFEDLRSNLEPLSPSTPAAESPSLAAQAIRASSVHRDSSISSAYGESVASAYKEELPNRPRSNASPRNSGSFEYTSMKSLNESKYGFWGVLTRKTKSLIDDDNASQKFENSGRKQSQVFDSKTGGQFQQSFQSPEGLRKAETLPSQRSPDSIASSLNHIGGTIKNKLEEGLTIVENKTAEIIQETRKLNIRRKGSGCGQYQMSDKSAQPNFSHVPADHETQLKASRDVRWQMCTTGLHKLF